MIGKIIGAGMGAKAAEHTSKIGGPLGAVLGATAPVLLRRMSIPAMIAIGAGGYLVKKLIDKQEEEKAAPAKKTATKRKPPRTSKAPAAA
ncbi:hypothetical protein P7228_03480 [Altererythrobacter arenosus]|uniref:Uncharacterized protein n=1 Tax=Altererythrobacter arenosus TaxID=3032592 RepID=A0ABY8FTP5_9SPHN|nr:hypothetical protein [Altererythrobacter sp. CAU 1644]WFL78142.1 hypothetical protein P7228_03480 [Altererythrobacter sp. CAU 1644]